MRSVLFLTGGALADGFGLPEFRDVTEVWHGYALKDVSTVEGFVEDSARLLKFHAAFRDAMAAAEPSPVHHALAAFERARPDGSVSVITLNRDDFQQRAGSRHVVPLYGEPNLLRCQSCFAVFDDAGGNWRQTGDCPSCHREGRLRPLQTFFGERPFYILKIQELLEKCDVFCAVGCTASDIQPLTSMFEEVKRIGKARTVWISEEEPPLPFDRPLGGLRSVGEFLPLL